MPTYPETKLKNMMAKVFGVPVEAITDDASPDSVEKWDSLRHMNLVLALEEEFGIELTDDQVVEILSYPLIKIILGEHGAMIE
jgi:acyl carrier protein